MRRLGAVMEMQDLRSIAQRVRVVSFLGGGEMGGKVRHCCRTLRCHWTIARGMLDGETSCDLLPASPRTAKHFIVVSTGNIHAPSAYRHLRCSQSADAERLPRVWHTRALRLTHHECIATSAVGTVLQECQDGDWDLCGGDVTLCSPEERSAC